MFDDMKKSLEQVLKVVSEDLQMVRTGRAKPSLVEEVMVEAYPGTRLPLKELAGISAPDPHMIVIQPWDQSVLHKIEVGLQKSDLNLGPVVDGNLIRISIPALTEERRLDLVKMVKQKIESGHEMMRSVRVEQKKEVDDQKGKAGVSEDDIKNWLAEMQKIHDEYLKKLEELGEKKEKELMEI
jgi:ribosome recycling factor